MSEVDTCIRHVTKTRAILCVEPGFALEEARQYRAESQALINQMLERKAQLMDARARQADAAELLHVSQARVSDVVNKKTSKFTIDTLVETLAWIGKPVRMVAG
ncbi:putative cytoplasmic protein (STMD1.83 protein) [Candidatus Burkholderia humilis]|nr:putative cytoplasmic protein (STMD1.83 protein) [Candidatus Burkholderia humilis]